MATIGEVSAIGLSKEDSLNKENQPYVLYFGVFFDGTSNNMIQKQAAKNIKEKLKNKIKDDNLKYNTSTSTKYYEREVVKNDDANIEFGANKTIDVNGTAGVNQSEKKGFSNIAILHSLYQGLSKNNPPEDKNVIVYNIYIEGAGTISTNDIRLSAATGKKGALFGSGKSGVVYLVSKALEIAFHRISVVINTIPIELRDLTEVKFDVFGFSRGATCARLFSYCVAFPEKSLSKQNLPCVEDLLDSYLSRNFINNDNISLYGEKTISNKEHVTVEMLGLFDSVSSVGGLSISSYSNNTTYLGLYSPTFERVKNSFHICAIDEFRSHFALTNIGSRVLPNSGEIYLPGCHSDIGGGYIKSNEYEDKFKIQYALKGRRYNTLNGTNETFPIHLQISQASVSKPDNTIDFINYIRNYGYLGEIKHPTTNTKAPKFWGYINNCRMIDTPGLIYHDVEVSRQSLPGYSNIPLKIMIDRSKKDTKRELFRSQEKLFGVDPEIKNLFNTEDTTIDSLALVKGERLFYYPGGGWDSQEYRALRKYLHFSAQWYEGMNLHINGNKVERIFYNGDQGDTTMHTYSEYNL